jgi:hypothetical protein
LRTGPALLVATIFIQEFMNLDSSA